MSELASIDLDVINSARRMSVGGSVANSDRCVTAGYTKLGTRQAGRGMTVSFKGAHFPRDIILHAVFLSAL